MPTVSPATPSPKPARPLTLPLVDIEWIGAEAAWAAVRSQAIHRIETHNGVPASWHRAVDLFHNSSATESFLAHMVDDDPAMLSRVAWSPTEFPTARMLLDRAIGLSMPGPKVPIENIWFWTEGRSTALTSEQSSEVLIPVQTFSWLATGDWDSTDRPDSGPKRVQTFYNGAQERYDPPRAFVHHVGGPARITGGEVAYCRNGRLHRSDGPAVVRANGDQEWWLHGKPFHASQVTAATD